MFKKFKTFQIGFYFLIFSVGINILHAQSNISSTSKDIDKDSFIDSIMNLSYENLVLNYRNSEQLLNTALEINTNPKFEAILHSQKAIVSYFQADYEKSIQENLKSIRIYDSLGMKKEAGGQYTQLGYQLKRINLDKGFYYMRKGIHLLKESNDSTYFSAMYGNYGVLLEMRQDYDSMMLYYNLSLRYAINTKDSLGIPYAYNRLAVGYTILKDEKGAVEAIRKSTSIRESRNDHQGIVENNNFLGGVYLEFGNYEKAIAAYEQSLLGSRKYNTPYLTQDNLYSLSKCYAATGDYNNAYGKLSEAFALKDSLLTGETANKIAQLEEFFNVENKNKEIALLSKDNEIHKAELKQRNTLIFGFSIGFVLLLLLSFFVFRGYRIKKKSNDIISQKNVELNESNDLLFKQKEEIEKQKHLVEEKQREIIDSINYAQRLQKAILAPETDVKKYFPNSFLLYKPKDIVAGDFYFFEVTDTHIFYAAADCTGHGVPGAMVSIVCSNALTRCVKEFGLTEPGKILDKTRELILETFQKSGEDVKDGMDISFISMNRATKRIEWSGANNPLWYIENTELKEIKADKQPIGKDDHAKPFTTHQLPPNITSIYLFTDGYADQFGGPKGKKFKYANLQKLLLDNSNQQPETQNSKLETEFENWKGDFEQVDDVCIIGIRF